MRLAAAAVALLFACSESPPGGPVAGGAPDSSGPGFATADGAPFPDAGGADPDRPGGGGGDAGTKPPAPIPDHPARSTWVPASGAAYLVSPGFRLRIAAGAEPPGRLLASPGYRLRLAPSSFIVPPSGE